MYFYSLSRIFYFLFNVFQFKYLDLKSWILPTVRIQGKKFISISKSTIQRQGWLLALKIDENNPEIIIEQGCAIGDFSHITAIRKVHIEENVLIANNVYISDNAHSFSDIEIPIIKQKVVFKKEVQISSGSWIGENVCIIGANIGKNSIIGANSVVTHDIPDYCVAVGSPAVVIKKYDFSQKNWIRV